MTVAAQSLHLTQSGVSQHMQALEQELGLKLFERVKRRLYPTREADLLYAEVKKAITSIGLAFDNLKPHDKEPEGLVRLGLPVEYGVSVVLPVLSELGKRHPKLKFQIVLDFATEIAELVLNEKLDFGVIDDFKVDRKLRSEFIAEEGLLLCASRDYIKRFGPVRYNVGYFSQLDYVDYKEGEPVLRSWFRHHLGRQNFNVTTRAHIFDVEGVSRFVRNGLGAGVLPDHRVERLKKDGVDLYVYEGKKAALRNKILLIHMPFSNRPRSQLAVIEALRAIQKG